MVLAFTVSTFVYFSFGNIYSSKILNYVDFSGQFQSGVYQYRILSGYFLFWIYDFLSAFNIDYSIFKFKFLEPASEPKMYFSFYLLNTIFLVLSSAILLLITETKNFVATQTEKILLVSVAIFVIAFSQFVIVPYDVSSYFFLLIFFCFLLKYLDNNSTRNLAVLVLILLISTVNRESSALSLSLAATLLFSKFGLRKETILPISLLLITFIGVYFGLRMMSEKITTNDGNVFLQNFTDPKNIMGLLFWLTFLVFTLIIARNQKTKGNIIFFHLFAIPYFIMCFYTGIIYEIRLYVPVFITCLLLSRTDFSRLH